MNVQDIQSKRGAFAAVRENGSAVTIVTCGAADCSGDSRVAQDQGMNVQQIQANDRAFAAVLGDGLVVTWGGGGSWLCRRIGGHLGSCYSWW